MITAVQIADKFCLDSGQREVLEKATQGFFLKEGIDDSFLAFLSEEEARNNEPAVGLIKRNGGQLDISFRRR